MSRHMPVYYLPIPTVGVAMNNNAEEFIGQVAFKEAKLVGGNVYLNVW